jgi:hypothetical protein
MKLKSANLAVLFLEAGVTSPRESDFVPHWSGSNKSNRSEVSASASFLAKLNNEEIY